MPKDLYIRRDIEKKILKYMKQFPAVILTGPRQSGKSTTLKKLFSKTHQYISFDDIVMRQRCQDDPKLFLDTLKDKVVLDEVQYVPELLSYIKIKIDNNRRKYGRFIITGSQQFNLIKGLGDTLAGRAGILNLFPLNFNEINSVVSLKKKHTVPEKAFIVSCLRGSFPEITARPKLDPVDWYASYMQTYLERDVRGLHNIGNLREFHRFLQLLAGRCSQMLNLSSFANDLGVSVNTIKNWLSVLIASNIIIELSPYYSNFGKRIIKNPKIYFIDTGLVAYLLGISSKGQVIYGPLSGQLFENYVFSETYKIITGKGRVPNLFYYRTRDGLEVDLIIAEGNKLYPYEIKITKSPRKEISQSMEKFLKLKGGNEKGKIICLAEDTFKITNNITVLSSLSYFKELGMS